MRHRNDSLTECVIPKWTSYIFHWIITLPLFFVLLIYIYTSQLALQQHTAALYEISMIECIKFEGSTFKIALGMFYKMLNRSLGHFAHTQ